MKKMYLKPQFEYVMLDLCDILTASPTNNEDPTQDDILWEE